MRSPVIGNGALKSVAAFVVSLSIIGCSGSSAPSIPAAGSGTLSAATNRVKPQSARAMAVTPLCPIGGVGPGIAMCNSVIRTDITANSSQQVGFGGLPGLHPADLRAAYGVTQASTTDGAGQTVAIVVANHNPLLEFDLNIYRAEFGIAPCNSFTGCLKTVMESGTSLNTSPVWSAESDLDVEMVSAICPKCHIIVSEARSNQISDLAEAAGAAVTAGATVVSNSYATIEDPTSLAYDHYYDTPGVPMTAGGGDDGYGAAYPASSQYVTAVGGTTLLMDGSNVASETAWSSSGGGCSSIVSKPAWQDGALCSSRATNDVAVVGDPATGVAVWLSSFGGWNVLGGTSVGAPVVASLYALAANGRSIDGPASLYAHASAFRNVTASGTYQGVVGLGAPTGLGAF